MSFVKEHYITYVRSYVEYLTAFKLSEVPRKYDYVLFLEFPNT